MPSDFFLKSMNAVHRAVQKASGNRLLWNASGMPVLELTTLGRKSGQPRSVMLTAPYIDDGSYVIVASRGGDDTHPAWFLNLRDNPEVTVRLNNQPPVPMHARVATAEERDRLWPLVIKDHRNYAGYQKRTSRVIPLVLLDPAGTKPTQ